MNILLIHGWDYDNYNKRTKKKAWSNRSKFIKELEKKYTVYYPDLPGFGLEEEPNAKKWTLDDYATFIKEYINIIILTKNIIKPILAINLNGLILNEVIPSKANLSIFLRGYFDTPATLLSLS